VIAASHPSSILARRLVSPLFADSAFDGEGARLYGGGWNSKGTPMVYTSSSLALAAMEMLVHLLRDPERLKDLYVYIDAVFDNENVLILDPALLPKNWRDDVRITRTVGDQWVTNRASLVLEVPSAVIPEEPNYLINPKHPDAGKLLLTVPQPFQFDPRLI